MSVQRRTQPLGTHLAFEVHGILRAQDMHRRQSGDLQKSALGLRPQRFLVLDDPNRSQHLASGTDRGGASGQLAVRGVVRKMHHRVGEHHGAVLVDVLFHVGHLARQDAAAAQRVDHMPFKVRVGEDVAIQVLDGHRAVGGRGQRIGQHEQVLAV